MERYLERLRSEITSLKEDIAETESAISVANDLLNSKLGHMLADFCGKNYKDESALKAIKREIKASGNPWGVTVKEAKDIRRESFVMVSAFYVGFCLWGWFNYYRFDRDFDLAQDIENAVRSIQSDKREIELYESILDHHSFEDCIAFIEHHVYEEGMEDYFRKMWELCDYYGLADYDDYYERWELRKNLYKVTLKNGSAVIVLDDELEMRHNANKFLSYELYDAPTITEAVLRQD